MKVSVVIPCRDYVAYLPEAIESALAQTSPPHQVIVVDDGSRDRSLDVARSYAQVTTIALDGRGPAAARNAGLDAVTGELVVFLDADDALEPDYLEACLAPLQANPALGFVYTQVRYVGARTGVSQHLAYDLERLKRDNTIHASALLRTAAVRSVRYDEAFAEGFEDWDLYLALAARGVSGFLLDRPLLRYRQHTASRSHALKERRSRRYRAQLRLLRKHRALFSTSERRALRRKFRRRFLLARAREILGV